MDFSTWPLLEKVGWRNVAPGNACRDQALEQLHGPAGSCWNSHREDRITSLLSPRLIPAENFRWISKSWLLHICCLVAFLKKTKQTQWTKKKANKPYVCCFSEKSNPIPTWFWLKFDQWSVLLVSSHCPRGCGPSLLPCLTWLRLRPHLQAQTGGYLPTRR